MSDEDTPSAQTVQHAAQHAAQYVLDFENIGVNCRDLRVNFAAARYGVDPQDIYAELAKKRLQTVVQYARELAQRLAYGRHACAAVAAKRYGVDYNAVYRELTEIPEKLSHPDP